MQSGLILGVWGAVSVFALISSIISLWLHWRTGSNAELQSEVRQLGSDVEDLYDSVEKWTQRARVRQLREGKEKAAQLTGQPTRGTPEYKAFLRAKAAGKIQ